MGDKQNISSLVTGGEASAGPPLGPALGPMGVNIMEVISAINEKTNDFKGMKVPVTVTIDSDTKKWEIEIGIPSALSMLIMSVGLFIYNIILSKTNNPDSAIAAYATVHRIEHLFFIPIISISTSMITLTGMFYGAKKYNLIKTTLIHCLKYTLGISILFGLFFYFLSYRILPIFINDRDVINIGISYFNIFSFAIPFVTLSMICSRTIQGLGKSYPMFIITCLRVIVISCSLAWYFIIIQNKPIEYAWISILISRSPLIKIQSALFKADSFSLNGPAGITKPFPIHCF